MIVEPTDIWHDKREDIVCFSLLTVCHLLAVTPFLCQCYMNACLSLRCISIYTNALKMYIIKLRIETDKKIWIYVKLLQIFFLHFVVEKNWMRGVENTCGGAWEPILFFFGLIGWICLRNGDVCLCQQFGLATVMFISWIHYLKFN